MGITLILQNTIWIVTYRLMGITDDHGNYSPDDCANYFANNHEVYLHTDHEAPASLPVVCSKRKLSSLSDSDTIKNTTLP